MVVNGNTYTAITTASGGAILTTPLGAPDNLNTISIGGSTLTLFAGLKEDPFFFDVE